MTNPPIHHGRRVRRAERAFSIIEVLIAALVLAVVVVGATAVLGGTSRSLSSNRVRDHQSTLANAMLARMQADPTWTSACQTPGSQWAETGTDCDLTEWLASAYPNVGRFQEHGEQLDFDVRVAARGYDLGADGRGPADKDGLRPDLWRVTVSAAPSKELAARFQHLAPTTIRAELNPSIRMQTGRVTIDACIATNQSDERMPIASCAGSTDRTKLLPPGPLNMTSTNSINGTCDGPVSQEKGSDERDCIAYKCADPDITAMPGQGNVGCASMPGWEPPSQWDQSERDQTSVVMSPAQGSVTLKSTRTGRVFGPITLQSGRATFLDMPVGEFEVTTSIRGTAIPWRSKSVPSTGLVAVEPGLNSRAVLLFRPPPTGRVKIEVSSIDVTKPWQPVPYPGLVSLEPDGTLVDSGSTVKICLVPAPQGRLVDAEVKCIQVARSTSTVVFNFTDVEPGLYTAYLGDPTYNDFYPLSGTAGFLWVPEGGEATGSKGAPTKITYVNSMCASDVRKAMVAGGTTDPTTGKPVEPCSSPSGPPPAGGGGGGGSQ